MRVTQQKQRGGWSRAAVRVLAPTVVIACSTYIAGKRRAAVPNGTKNPSATTDSLSSDEPAGHTTKQGGGDSQERAPEEEAEPQDVPHGRTWRILTAASVFLLSALLLSATVFAGVVFGETPGRLARVAIVAFLFTSGALLYKAWQRNNERRRHAAGQFAQVALPASLSVLAGLYALSGLVIPQVAAANAPLCRGLPPATEGSSFRVSTQPGGVNVRTAPNISAKQADRLPGGCGAPVDGFCLGGTVIRDAADRDYVDTRWFRLARVRGWRAPLAQYLSGGAKEERFIAAGAIDEFVSDDIVEKLSKDECRGATPVGEPGPASMTARLIDPGDEEAGKGQEGQRVKLEVTAENTFEFGFALRLENGSRTGNPYRNIPPEARPTDISKVATWNPVATSVYLKSDRSDVIIYGSRCLAIGAPIYPKTQSEFEQSAFAYQIGRGGVVDEATVPELTKNEWRAFAAEACREPNP